MYVGVYTRRFAGEAPGLMKYCEIIQDLASRGFNWKFYDENFQFLRQSSASAFLGEVFTGTCGCVLNRCPLLCHVRVLYPLAPPKVVKTQGYHMVPVSSSIMF